MLKNKIKNYLFNYYLILTIATAGFTGFFILEDIFDEGGVIAETIIVDRNGNGDYSTIQDAIDNVALDLLLAVVADW